MELSFLPIPSGLIPNQLQYANFITGLNIYARFAESWYGGISTYGLFLVPNGQDVFTYSQGYHITSLFARYYPNNSLIKYFIEQHVGVGNLCVCTSTTAFSNGGIIRLKFTEGVYLGAGIGFDMKLTPFIIIKPNLKAFYILNNFEDKAIHLRPFLTFVFLPRFRNQPVIFNPRF